MSKKYSLEEFHKLSMGGHGIWKGTCGHVISQCRCMHGHEPVVIDMLCKKCSDNLPWSVLPKDMDMASEVDPNVTLDTKYSGEGVNTPFSPAPYNPMGTHCDTVHSDIKEILYPPRDIDERVQQLAKQIQKDYSGQELVVVSVLNGAMMFTTDLIRYLHMRLEVDFIGASSYRDGMTSKELFITKPLSLNITGKHVLLVDDIADSGKTLSTLKRIIKEQNPKSVKTCVLFNKPSGHTVPEMTADYIAYDVGPYFIVGYGLDYNNKYRNLPYVGILREECIKK